MFSPILSLGQINYFPPNSLKQGLPSDSSSSKKLWLTIHYLSLLAKNSHFLRENKFFTYTVLPCFRLDQIMFFQLINVLRPWGTLKSLSELFKNLGLTTHHPILTQSSKFHEKVFFFFPLTLDEKAVPWLIFFRLSNNGIPCLYNTSSLAYYKVLRVPHFIVSG